MSKWLDTGATLAVVSGVLAPVAMVVGLGVMSNGSAPGGPLLMYLLASPIGLLVGVAGWLAAITQLQKDDGSVGVFGRWNLAVALWAIPPAVVLPGVPMVVFGGFAIAVACLARGPGSWKDDASLVSARVAWAAMRSGSSGPRPWRTAAGWAAWWWMAVLVGMALTTFGVFAVASSIMGMGPQGGGSAAALVAFPILLVAAPFFVGGLMLAGALWILVLGLAALLPVCQQVLLSARRQVPERWRAHVVQGVFDLAFALPLLAFVVPGIDDDGRLLVAMGSFVLVWVPLLGARVVLGPALAVLPPGRAVVHTGRMVTLQGAAILRGLVVSGLPLLVITVVGWFFVATAMVVTSPVLACVGAVVHGVLLVVDASSAGHGYAAAVEFVGWFFVSSALGARPLARLLHGYGVYWETLVRCLDGDPPSLEPVAE